MHRVGGSDGATQRSARETVVVRSAASGSCQEQAEPPPPPLLRLPRLVARGVRPREVGA